VGSDAAWWKVKARGKIKQAKVLGESAAFCCTEGRDVLAPGWPDPPGVSKLQRGGKS